jgi:hypothetical protein
MLVLTNKERKKEGDSKKAGLKLLGSVMKGHHDKI